MAAMLRKFVPTARVLLLASLILFAGLLAYPVRNMIMRSAILAMFVVINVTLLAVIWKRVWARVVLLAIQAVVILFFLLPGREVDAAALREAYLHSLLRYQGTRYVWGGESCLGVDCSGLMRAAIIDAHAKEAIRTMNPALARHTIWLWWKDASARELAAGYDGETVPGPAPERLEALTGMHPGDMAVTADGSHVIAYLGDGQWIQADPYRLYALKMNAEDRAKWSVITFTPRRWACFASLPGETATSHAH